MISLSSDVAHPDVHDQPSQSLAFVKGAKRKRLSKVSQTLLKESVLSI